ncbi:hypothetical protein M2437_002381 [Methylorubrum pseudosasae]|nr:hypothetical protein [Methylorubrum pseudosasae]
MSVTAVVAGERPLRADEEVGEVRARFDQGIEIVAADPPLHLRVFFRNLVTVRVGECKHSPRQILRPRAAGHGARRVAGEPEAEGGAVVEQRLDAEHVIAHLAVAQRAGAAGIVAGHAADGAAGRGRGLDREEPTVGFQPCVEALQHVAGLDSDRACFRVVGEHAVEVARAIDHEAGADRLAVLRGATAAQDHGDVVVGRDLQRRGDVGGTFGEDHARRHDLVDRGVGRVASAGEGVEASLALQHLRKLARQSGRVAGLCPRAGGQCLERCLARFRARAQVEPPSPRRSLYGRTAF